MADGTHVCIYVLTKRPDRPHNRIAEKIETVIEDGRLARAKVEKHRECWPTAFYEQDCEGDPIFVDRMGILGALVSSLLRGVCVYPNPPPLTPSPPPKF